LRLRDVKDARPRIKFITEMRGRNLARLEVTENANLLFLCFVQFCDKRRRATRETADLRPNDRAVRFNCDRRRKAFDINFFWSAALAFFNSLDCD